ncbi:MAG: hypothetical protein CMK07_04665 [Ponticaulis sp.]|nr:hypothetical protein [Ponticaulis sp.]
MNGGALPLDFIGTVLSFAVTMSCLAMTLRLALTGEMKGVAGLQLGPDEGRLYIAHVMFYFVLFLLGLIATVLVSILTAPVIAMLVPDIGAVAEDQAAFQQLAEEFSRTPTGIALSILFLGLVSLPLLYMSARLVTFPAATLAEKRVRIFDTWAWTKGEVWRVIAAMIFTLAPLLVLTASGVFIASALTGITMFPLGGNSDAVTISPMSGFMYGIIVSLFDIPYNLALGGLSAFMYKGFKPSDD